MDVGFAFLPAYWGKGYAYESAAAVMAHGKDVLGIQRIVAITSTDNESSMKLLQKLGLRFDRILKLWDDDPGTNLFVPAG